MLIDLRSDTVTQPSQPMREAMARAEVGDDVYGEDPTVNELQALVADLLGHEAALFCGTGSLANLLAVRALVPVGQEIVCEANAHIARAELGAHALISSLTMRTWNGAPADRAAIEALWAPDLGPFLVRTAAISVENTHNFAGGTISEIADLEEVARFARAHNLGIHLDGARLWNAHVATGTPLSRYGACADAVTVCLSKGLGAPVGSLLVGKSALIEEARVWRKRLGGGMRQIGVLAAAGLYAVKNHVEDLAHDHHNAQILASALGADLPQSNIVLIDVPDAPALVLAAREQGVLVSAVGRRVLRLVTHRDVDAANSRRAAGILAGLLD